MRKLRIPLSAVLYKEDERWIAHCLELDLIGDGETRKDALHSLSGAIGTQLHSCLVNNAMDCFFSPADSKIFQMYAEGKDLGEGAVDGALTITQHSSPDRRVEADQIHAREYDPELEEECKGELACV